jgi:CBS domain-containing protein
MLGVATGSKGSDMRVQDVMTTDVTTVTPETPLKDAARLLLQRGVSGLPVVRGDAVVGVLSEADLLALERGEPRSPKHRFRLMREREREISHGVASTVGEAMTSPPITVRPVWTVAGAASLMLDRGINRLPVVDMAGRLVGIVTRADVVRAFARTDDAIERDVREAIAFHQALVLDDSAVDVTVRAGEVALGGAVRTHSQAQRLPLVAAGVPGVVDVRSALTWSEDDR